MKRFIAIAFSIFTFHTEAQAQLLVVTTTQDLRSLVQEVGGQWVSVEAIARGTQDPHFIEAKPSYMVKLSKADLVVAIGLDLEMGWLPNVVQGARNPKVNPGASGYLEIGPISNPLEATGETDRSKGDVHPLGNPHVTLDPIRMGKAALKIAEKLGELDVPHAADYATKAKAFQDRMETKGKAWQARIDKTGVKEIVTYHKTLTYFLDRFKLGNPAILEPKPGIPPTAGHTLEVIRIMKEKNVSLILVENFFDPTVTVKIRESLPAVRAVTTPVSVEGAPGIQTLDDLYERLVSIIEGKEV